MSNGDDVLDNWEEFDEAGLNSSVQKLKNSSISSTTCEKITKSSSQNSGTVTLLPTITSTTCNTLTDTSAAANTKPAQMKLLQRSPTQDSSTTTTSKSSAKSPLDDMSATFQPVMMVLHKPQDEYHSANYTPPIANQTVKILRRPTQTAEPRNNGIRPKLPLKTLQQREQEYAEARLRILGSAKNPEDDEQKTTTIVTTTTEQTPVINSMQSTPAAALINNPFTNMVTSNPKINSPKLQVGPNQYNNHYNQQLQNQQQQQYQQKQQQNYFYNQQQPPQSPAYNNNNRTYSLNPLLGLGPMGAIGQPAQYQATTLSSSQTQQQQPPQPTQQHVKYQQFNQKSSQLHQKSQQQQQQQQQTWSPVVGGSVSSSSLRQPPNDTILRLPRGPDGSTGFQMRR